jgi:hypothetical protein
MSTSKIPLAEALGHGYIHEFFRGALFLRGNTIYQIRACYGEGIDCHAVDKGAEIGSAAWRAERLPMDALTSFSDIKWPKLGYRNLVDVTFGNQVAFISSSRSVQRGLKYDHLGFEPLAVGETLGGISRYGRSIDTILRIFFPVWYTFKEGMKKIHAKEIASFAINEDVAIGLSVDQGPDRFADIYYRGKVVGMVQENDDIMIANKTIKRGNLKQLYTLLEN